MSGSGMQVGSGCGINDDFAKFGSEPPLKENQTPTPPPTPPKKIFFFIEPKGCFKEREDYSLYIFPPDSL